MTNIRTPFALPFTALLAAIKERFAAQSAQAHPSSPEGYADTIAAELSKWRRVVKASGARAE